MANHESFSALPYAPLALVLSLALVIHLAITSLYLMKNMVVHYFYLENLCIIFNGTNYISWSMSFRHFLQIIVISSTSRTTAPPPPLEDPTLETWFIQYQVISTWMLKMLAPTLSKPMQLISLSMDIWDEWAHIYRYESNISHIANIFEYFFRTKQSRHCLHDFYAPLFCLLN